MLGRETQAQHLLTVLSLCLAWGCSSDPTEPDADVDAGGEGEGEGAGEGEGEGEGEPEEQGTLGAACRVDGTCDAGLVCVDGEVCETALSWGACDPEELPPGFTMPDDLECARADVPLDRAAPEGPTVTLRVAVLRSTGASEAAVFQLAGGPGGSAVAQAGIIEQVLPGLRRRFDLVFVDQRGTGASGYLDCADWSAEGLARCAELHADVMLDHYLTADAADDIDTVRGRMGYATVLLRGGSYGTRVALEVARRYPARVEAMVLDGLVTPDDDLFTALLQKTDRGVDRLVADCAEDERCIEIAPALGDDLAELLRRLEDEPRAIRVDGQRDVEDAPLFKYALGKLVDDWYWRFRVPRAVAEAAAGEYDTWDGLLSELFGVPITSDTRNLPLHVPGAPGLLSQSSYVAYGVYMAVICAESLPNVESVDALYELADAQRYGDGSMLEVLEACASWDVEPIPAELRAPVVSDVPTLLLSGAIDFITPAEAGEHAAETLTNARHVVMPDATHSVMITPCGGQIITDFLEAHGDIDRVDTSCVDRYRVEFE